MLQFLRSKLEMDVDGEGSSRAPLASEETMESPVQILSGQVSEFTRGKEFKVGIIIFEQTNFVCKQMREAVRIE